MSTVRIHTLGSQAVRTTSAVQQSMGDFTYGAAGILEMLQAGSGIASSVLNTLPLFSMLFATIDILKAIDESWSALKRNIIRAKVEVHAKSLTKILSNGTLLAFGYENLSQTMSLGSPALGLICDGLAIKAAGDWLIASYDFMKAYQKYNRAMDQLLADDEKTRSSNSYSVYENMSKYYMSINDDIIYYLAISDKVIQEYEEAKRKFIINTFNFIGWGLLALSKAAALTAVAPYLLFIGFTCLAFAGLYAMGKAYGLYSANFAQELEDHSHIVSRWLAFCSIFPKPAHGARPEDGPIEEENNENLTQKKEYST